jgi:ferredoxin/flavodoxin---NADP+ reductase
LKTVFVVGAGPAGLFAAQKIALAGHQVVIFNRDIKPGGLAEYGIYPTKDKMKIGLRKQFAKVLGLPNVHYMGNVPVGANSNSALSIPELRGFSPTALVFAVGAQGTKKLGLGGESALGVYSAKDFVYYYNLLPPFSSQNFSTGKRVAIVGMGNVMVDIARWLLLDTPERTAEEVIVIARRGPFEAKFDKKEFDYIESFLDRQRFDEELRRIEPQLAGVGQEIAKLSESTFPVLAKPPTPPTDQRRLHFRFLSSPQAISSDATGRISRLTVTENDLVMRGEDIAAKSTDRTFDLEVDTMIFAIGDVADPALGLPYDRGGYVTNPVTSDPKGASYEVFEPQSGSAVNGTFVLGWARKASEGLVGIARHDGEQGAAHVLKYLENAPETSAAAPEEIVNHLQSKGVRAVDKADWEHLVRAEETEGQLRGDPRFKFADNQAMLAAIEEHKSKAAASM